MLNYDPETAASDVLRLICRVVTFTPQNQNVTSGQMALMEQLRVESQAASH